MRTMVWLGPLALAAAIGACVGDDPASTDTPDSPEPDATILPGRDADAVVEAAAPDAGACDPNGPYQTPQAVAGLPAAKSIVRFSADELTAYFALNDDAGVPALHLATRARIDAPFGAPERLGGGINDDVGESEPTISPDGLTLVYVRDFTQVAARTRDLWQATRASVDAAFASPALIANVNDPSRQDEYPSIGWNSDLWFVHQFDAGQGADAAGQEMVHAQWVGGGWNAPGPVDGVNLAGVRQYYPLVTADLRRIYFIRDGHVWTATRATADVAFSGAQRLTEIEDSYAGARPAWVSADGCRLYFTVESPQLTYVTERSAAR